MSQNSALSSLSEYEWQIEIAVRMKGAIMKIVVISGTGLIGHEAVSASPNSGVNTLTGEGLADVPKQVSVVVDVSNSQSFDEDVAMKFFNTATRNLISI